MNSNRKRSYKLINDFIAKNKQIGSLILTNEIKYQHNKQKTQYQSFIKCYCKCGKTAWLNFRDIKRQNTTSCGCSRIKAMKNNKNKKPKYSNNYYIFSPYYTDYIKSSAKRRNIEFNLTYRDLNIQLLKQNNKCYYTNELLTLPDFSLNCYFFKSQYNVSVDRLDSNKGYDKNNIVLCTQSINRFKNNYSTKEFYNMCQMVVNQLQNQNHLS